MMDEQNDRAAAPDGALPFDLRTLALGLWRRRRVLGLVCLGSCVMGAVGGFAFGSRVYEAHTVLLYKPSEVTAPSLQTQAHLVKIQPHLAEVRRQLKLECTLERLGAASQVSIQPNASLIIIRNEWSSAEQAAAIANALREVFVNNQETIAKAALSNQIRDLEGHLEVARQRLETAGLALQRFTAEHNVVSLDTEGQEYLNGLATVERLYEQARVEREAIERNDSEARFLSGGLDQAVAKGGSLPAELDGLTETNTRLQWLHSAIQEDREERVNRIEMERLEAELLSTEKLKALGMISESEYKAALASYEKQKTLLTDSEKSRGWKKELRALMDARLQRLAEAREQLREKLRSLPQVQREYAALSREVSFWEAQAQDLEQQRARAHRARDSKSSDFSVVSEAQASPLPASSSRRFLALALTVAGAVLGFGVVLAQEILDTTIKSAAEFSLKVPLPLLGTIPLVSSNGSSFPSQKAPALVESFRMIAQRLLQAVPEKGARILVASAWGGEGTTTVAAELAACFGRQGERVVLIDAQGRDGGPFTSSSLVPQGQGCGSSGGKGLGAYLSAATSGIGEIVHPTQLPGVACIPRLGQPVDPDLVCSERMRALLGEASAHYRLILVDAPPALSCAETLALARWSHAIVLVVRSRKCRAALVRKAADRLGAAGAPIAGAVLNCVEPFYMEESHENTDHL